MFARTKTVLLSVVLTFLWLAHAQGAQPAVLQQVPNDASIVLVVNNLQDLSTKLSNAATSLNVPTPPDLLGVLTQRIGLTKGLDSTGSAALIVYVPKAGDVAPVGGPQFVLLLPTADPTSMLESYKPAAPELGISEIELPNGAQSSAFAAVVGSETAAKRFVAFAQDKDTLARYLARAGSLDKSLAPESLKSFEANDVVLYANVPQFSTQAIQGIESFKQMMAMGMNQPGNGGNALQQQMIDLDIKGFTQFLTDAQTGLVTFRISDNGMALGFSGSFKPESPTGKLVAAQKNLEAASLDGLPAGTLLAAGSVAWDPTSLSILTSAISDTLFQDATLAADPQFLAVKQSMELQKEMVALTSGAKFAFYQPEANTQGFVHGVMLANTSDSAKYQALLTQLAKLNFGGINPAAPEIKMTGAVEAGAITYKAITLDKYTLSYSAQPAKPGEAVSPQAQQALMMLNAIYGAGGITFFSGPLDKHITITIVGGDEKMARAAIDAARSHSKALTLAPEITTATGQTPPNAANVIYLPVAPWITLVQQRLMGAAPDAGAVGAAPSTATMSMAVTGSTATAELYVPTSAMIGISNALLHRMPPAATPLP